MTDADNFLALMQATRRAMDEASSKDNGRKFELTIAGSANPAKVAALRLPELDKVLDYVFVMTYDFDRAMGKTWHTQTLFPSRDHALDDPRSADTGIKAYRAAGFPARKLIFGMPLYGYRYTGVTKGDTLLQPNGNPSDAIAYTKILELLKPGSGYTRFEDKEAQAGWLYSASAQELITYVGKEELRSRADYVNQNDLGGFMFWHLSADTTDEKESLTIQSVNLMLGNDRSSFKKRSVCAPFSTICSIKSECSAVQEDKKKQGGGGGGAGGSGGSGGDEEDFWNESSAVVSSVPLTVQGLASLALGGVALAAL